MKTRDLVKLLKKSGCFCIREGGNHEIWYSPMTGLKFPVWRHTGEIPTGTLEQILKAAGIK